MAETPVTQAEWQKVMGNNPSHFKGKDNPVEMVSWNDCQEFCKAMNMDSAQTKYIYRLPTSAEWEEALGKDISEKEVLEQAWCYENSEYKMHPVKEKKPNEFGLYDMRGNVWEWCEDEIYGSDRVVRGGSWNFGARDLRAALRSSVWPDFRYVNVGFRLLRIPVSLDSLTLDPSASRDETREAIVESIRNKLREIEEQIERLK